MNEKIYYLLAFFVVSIGFWLTLSIREFMIAKKRILVMKEYLNKLLSKRQNLIPILLVSVEKVSVADTGLKEALLEARNLAKKEEKFNSKKIEYEMELSEKINLFFELAENNPEIKKSGYFMEVYKEIEEVEEKIEKAGIHYSQAVMEYNHNIGKKIFLVSAFLSKSKRENIFEFEK